MARIRAVLFDIDGTLLESNDAHAHAWVEALSKPDPDLVQVALERVGVEADEAVMLGDTPYDIEAAHNAGVITVALRCGGYWSDQELAGAVAIFDDPADLAANLDHSPLALDRESLPPPSLVKVRTRRIAEV